jgi:RNA polymerase sigma-70 factor (ECF subfamily)
VQGGFAHSSEAEATAEELDAILLEIVSAAQHSYPALRLPPDVFVAYLRDRIPAAVPVPLALRQMHTADLYLACGCARGDVKAIMAFDERCLRPLDRVLGKMGIRDDLCADVKQEIRRRVLVGDGTHAEIADFSGRGDLRSWVRVMAIRQALRGTNRARREVSVDDDELRQRITAPENTEPDRMKAVYLEEFKRAFDGAVQDLPARERTLLRQHYVDGLGIDELGSLYRVHRSTAARLLVRARARVLEATRARMISRLNVRSEDLESILRTIRSQIEISLHGLRRGRNR